MQRPRKELKHVVSKFRIATKVNIAIEYRKTSNFAVEFESKEVSRQEGT